MEVKIEQIKHLLGFPPISPINKMEADCFLVSEGTKNKPSLPLRGRETKLKGQNKCRVGFSVESLFRNENIDMNSKIFRKKWGWIEG